MMTEKLQSEEQDQNYAYMSIAVHQSVLALITFGMNVENAKFSSFMYGRRFPRKL